MKNLLLLLATLIISYYFYTINKNKTQDNDNDNKNLIKNIIPEQKGIENLEQVVNNEPNPNDTLETRGKLHSLFHSNIFNLLNNMIIHKTESKEVKDSYLAVVKANMGLLNIGRGYEHNFFNGTLSKNIAITFLEDLVNLYTKFILEENPAFTYQDLEIFKYMVDNHTIMMKDYQRIQQGSKGEFKRYKILFEKELRKLDNIEYSIVRVDGLEVLEDDNDKGDKSSKINNNRYDKDSDSLNKEIRNINITEFR
jgi:hypothetical protein